MYVERDRKFTISVSWHDFLHCYVFNQHWKSLARAMTVDIDNRLQIYISLLVLYPSTLRNVYIYIDKVIPEYAWDDDANGESKPFATLQLNPFFPHTPFPILARSPHSQSRNILLPFPHLSLFLSLCYPFACPTLKFTASGWAKWTKDIRFLFYLSDTRIANNLP